MQVSKRRRADTDGTAINDPGLVGTRKVPERRNTESDVKDVC